MSGEAMQLGYRQLLGYMVRSGFTLRFGNAALLSFRLRRFVTLFLSFRLGKRDSRRLRLAGLDRRRHTGCRLLAPGGRLDQHQAVTGLIAGLFVRAEDGIVVAASNEPGYALDLPWPGSPSAEQTIAKVDEGHGFVPVVAHAEAIVPHGERLRGWRAVRQLLLATQSSSVASVRTWKVPVDTLIKVLFGAGL